MNLFFRVLKKRPDGFHEIASLYQAISLGDFLTISFHDQIDILVCDEPSIPVDDTNLILKAADLFRRKTGIQQYFSFNLEKKIPVKAGLGGGSSNAATTLWGLNQLMQLGLSDLVLADWAAELGSDVPFFLTNGRAFCEGRGEILNPMPPVESELLWIAKPKEGLSTASVYREVYLSLLKNRDLQQVVNSHQSQSPIFFNDLEEAAFRLLPSLNKTKNALLDLGFIQVHMTGSGTAFFCLGDIHQPGLSHIDFYPVRFLYREEQSWYKFPY